MDIARMNTDPEKDEFQREAVYHMCCSSVLKCQLRVWHGISSY